jgi:hypothetical protein
MNEHAQPQQPPQRRRTNELPTIKNAEDARAEKAVDDRLAAVRRWIDEDDDACCRGID